MDTCVLIVEDNDLAREEVAMLLNRAGYRTAEAADGLEALSYLHSHDTSPHLILLDLSMPVMDGWDFLRQRRKDTELAKVPVVLFTATGGIDAIAAWALGAADTIRKPAEPDDLLAVVGRYC
jgi:CheY-like chemotaxis protein